jgi:hypothetical protein
MHISSVPQSKTTSCRFLLCAKVFFESADLEVCMFNPIGSSQSSNAQQQNSTTQAKAEPNPQHALPEDTVSLNSKMAGGVISSSNGK